MTSSPADKGNREDRPMPYAARGTKRSGGPLGGPPLAAVAAVVVVVAAVTASVPKRSPEAARPSDELARYCCCSPDAAPDRARTPERPSAHPWSSRGEA